jgi:hypothetical protein
MHLITFVLGGLEQDRAVAGPAILLETLQRADTLYLQAHPNVPPLESLARAGRMHFHPDPFGQKNEGTEFWADVPTALSQGIASDRTLAAWRAAELRKEGSSASVAFVWLPDALKRRSADIRPVVRATVLLPDGREDPVFTSIVQGRGARAIGSPDHSERGRFTYALDLFHGKKEEKLSQAVLQEMLDGLTAVDEAHLRAHPDTPLMRESGILYEEEPPMMEDWQDAATCLRMGTFDCDDGGPLRAAEIRVHEGLPARATFTPPELRPDGGYLYHIDTDRGDGRQEDISRDLGMR